MLRRFGGRNFHHDGHPTGEPLLDSSDQPGGFDFDREYIFGSRFGRKIYREIQPGNIYFFDWIDEEKQLGYHFSKETWANEQLVEKIIASRARFNPEDSTWTLIDAQVRRIAAFGDEQIQDFGTLDTALNMRLDNFGRPSEVIRNQITPSYTITGKPNSKQVPPPSPTSTSRSTRAPHGPLPS